MNLIASIRKNMTNQKKKKRDCIILHISRLLPSLIAFSMKILYLHLIIFFSHAIKFNIVFLIIEDIHSKINIKVSKQLLYPFNAYFLSILTLYFTIVTILV